MKTMTMKTGDNYKVRKGMWVEDCSGEIFEIIEIENNKALVAHINLEKDSKGALKYTRDEYGEMTADELAYTSWI